MAAKLRAHQVDVDPDFAPQSRPRSCTWPLPQPDLVGDEDGALGSGVAEGAEDCGLERRATAPAMAPAPPLGAEVGPLRKAKSSRRNAWGNLSYADLITKAIESAPDKRLTLSQIYDWMVRYVPYFKDKGDSNSSAGWKPSCEADTVTVPVLQMRKLMLREIKWLSQYPTAPRLMAASSIHFNPGPLRSAAQRN